MQIEARGESHIEYGFGDATKMCVEGSTVY